MNISQYLKALGKTKTELAGELRLSRPTLNQYIETFEAGQTIENERYNIIFKRLFSDRQIDRGLFEKRVEAVRYLLERDEKYDIGCLEPEAADIVARIHNNMVRDMSKGDWDRKVYDAILILLVGYNNNTVMRELAGYLSDLNSESDLSELSSQSKAYYSYYYTCFRRILDNPPSFDADSYESFIERKAELSAYRERTKAQTEQKVRTRLDNIIKEVGAEFKNNGVEATEDEIFTEVIRRMNKLNS